MTVYVVQDQRRYDKDSGEFVPKFDLSTAYEYGDLRYLLSPTAGPFNPKAIIDELQEGLIDFSSRDYLLLVGNPCLIGWAVAIASFNNQGRIRLLQWHGREQRYLPIEAELPYDMEGG